jgi:hypothetical protein
MFLNYYNKYITVFIPSISESWQLNEWLIHIYFERHSIADWYSVGKQIFLLLMDQIATNILVISGSLSGVIL